MKSELTANDQSTERFPLSAQPVMDHQAMLWMLSSGCCGPAELPAAGESQSAPFKRASQTNFSTAESERKLLDVLREVFSQWTSESGQWVVPLSGGTDSRAILLLLLEQGIRLPCVTWGKKESLNRRGSDAFLAREVAKSLKLEQRFLELDASERSFEQIVDRFVQVGGGRVDHISGYMDGFRMWEQLRDSGVTGIIRGDEAFGWVPVTNEVDVRHSVGLKLIGDFPNSANLAALARTWGVEHQIPEWLKRHDKESLAGWRDRLYVQFRIPSILEPLNDLKRPFVQVANPFLSPSVLSLVAQLPDEQRTNKILFRNLVDTLARKHGLKVPFAKSSATAPLREILSSPHVREVICDELNSENARNLFTPAFCDSLLRAFAPVRKSKDHLRSAIQQVKQMVPRKLRQTIRQQVPPSRVPGDVLALRAYMICRTMKFQQHQDRPDQAQREELMSQSRGHAE